jgi:O-antigen/teichoic acid export membrane protein
MISAESTLSSKLLIVRQIFGNTVVKSGLWYTFANFFIKGMVVFSIPIFTRLLSTADYGIVAVFNSYTDIFAIILGLALGQASQRGKIEFKDDFENYLSSIALLSLIVFVFFYVFLFIFSKPIQNLLEIKSLLYHFMIFQAYFTFTYRLYTGKLVLEYKYKTYSILAMIISVVTILASIYLIKKIFLDEKYYGRIFGTGSFYIVIGIAALLFLLSKGKNRINLKYWKAALVISVPYVFHNVSGIINAQFDRIVINKYIGASPTGIYSFAYNVGMLVTVLWQSMNTAFNPYFFDKIEKKRNQLVLIASKVYRDVFTLSFIVILFISPEIVKLLANENYWGGLYIVPLIFLALYFQVLISFEAKIEYANKMTFLTPIGTTISALINVILNIIFVPRYGYIAAAVTTVISYIVLFIYHFIVTKYLVKVTFYGLLFHAVGIIMAFFATVLFYVFEEMLLIRLLTTLMFTTILLVKIFNSISVYKEIQGRYAE